MKPDQVSQLKSEIEAVIKIAVKETVNGKIDRLDKKLDEYIKEDMKYKEEDKLRTQPVVDAFNNTSWLGKKVVTVLKFLGLLGGAIAAVLTIKKYFQ